MVAGIAVLVIYGGWLATLLWGSLMAFRGARNWTTILQLIGTGGMLAGAVGYGIGVSFIVTSFSSSMSAGPSSGPTSGPGFEAAWMVVMAVAGILMLLGAVLFTAGYVGMCARYGATVRRAQELEGLVGQFQQRFGPGS